MARLILSFLGPFQVIVDGRPATLFDSNKIRALLAYLAVESDRLHTRESLAGLLWPDYPSRSALNTLRSALANLRGAIGDRTADPPFLLITRESVWFNPASDHHLDVAELRTAAGLMAGEWERIAASIRGDFLEGFSIPDSAPFEEWLRARREDYRRQTADLYGRLATWRETDGDHDQAMLYARRQLELEAWDEDAHRRLMRLLALAGHRDQALAQYETCRRVLNAEFGVEPGRETRTLVGQIRDEMLDQPAQGAGAAIGAPVSPAPGEPPYKGLSYFDENDAGIFFGREALTAKLVAGVRDCLSLGGDRTRVLAVVGASGSGKSSILRAGLMPAMSELTGPGPGEQRVFRDSIILMTPGASPLLSLAANLTRPAGSVQPLAKLVDDLEAEPRTLHLAASRIAGRAESSSRVLLVIDQFEELFTLCRDEGHRRAFIDNLLYAAAIPGPVIVVLALRADFYPHCAPFDNLRQALAERQVYIGAMSPEELCRAIEEPARAGNWSIEPGLAELLVHEVSDAPGALPLLSHALLATWQRREGRLLTLAGYQAAGGVAGALAQTAEANFTRLSLQEQAMARLIFMRLIEVVDEGEDGRPTFYTRRRAKLTELALRPEEQKLVHDILTRLADSRLLTIGQHSVEVAHEALIHEWPRLLNWLNENRDALRLHRRVTASAQEWERSTYDEGLLYRGGQLAMARDWAAAHSHELNDLERRFVEAGGQAEENRQRRQLENARHLVMIEQQRATEQGRAAAGLRRRSALLVAALVALTLLSVLSFGFAHTSRRNARLAALNEAAARASAGEAAAHEAEAIANAEVATSRMLALSAANVVDTDPELSLLLALEALETAGTKEAGEALHLGLQASRLRRSFETGATGGRLVLMELSPDGTQLATAGAETATIWDAATGELRQQLPLAEPTPMHFDLDFNDSGSELALVSIDDSQDEIFLQTWDVAAGGLPVTRVILTEIDQTSDIALSPDWSLLAVSGEAGHTDLIDTATGRPVVELDAQDMRLSDLEFSPTGRRLATASPDGQVMIWDTLASVASGTGQELGALDNRSRLVRTGNLNKIAFIDETALVLGYLGEVEVWDLDGQAGPRYSLAGNTKLTKNFAVSDDRTRLATTAQDGITRIWDLATGEYLLSLARHQSPVDGAAFTPDGRELLTVDRDGLVRAWDARSLLMGEQGAFAVDIGVFDVELSPDEKQLALGNVAGPASIWDTATGQRLYTLPSGEGPVYRVAYSPDGRHLATVGQENQIRIWDAVTGAEVLSFSGHGGGAAGGLFAGTLDVAYSPDGTRLATAGADGLAIIWDPVTGRQFMTLAGHTGSIQTLVYSPDGRYIATSTDQNDTTIKVWDAATGTEIYTLAGHPVHVWGLAFSPDSRYLVSGGTRGVLKAWDMATGEEIYTVYDQSDEIGGIAFTPDGQFYLTTGSVPLRLRRINDGEEVMTIAGPTIWSLDLSHDGSLIYAADVDGMVRIFNLNMEDAIALAYERLDRWWRPDECLRYLHTEDCPPAPAAIPADG
jgi:WD40 repeat protein/DNA-binding SARP family transcriptional activator